MSVLTYRFLGINLFRTNKQYIQLTSIMEIAIGIAILLQLKLSDINIITYLYSLSSG